MRLSFRALLAAAVLVLTGGAAFAQAPPQPVHRLACGGYDIVPSGFRKPDRPTRILVQKGGRLMVTVMAEWTIVSVDCDDITADAVKELVVRSFSGGAHCCETIRIYALAETPKLLLEYAAGNAMGLEVRDLDGDGKKELLLGDDTFAYFDDLCYACSPSALPLVACFADGRFEDCTRRFPDLLRTARERYRARLKPSPTDEDLKEVEGAALGLVAVSELLGEEEAGLRTVNEAVGDEKVTKWLAQALPQVRDWAAARGKRITDGKR